MVTVLFSKYVYKFTPSEKSRRFLQSIDLVFQQRDVKFLNKIYLNYVFLSEVIWFTLNSYLVAFTLICKVKKNLITVHLSAQQFSQMRSSIAISIPNGIESE